MQLEAARVVARLIKTSPSLASDPNTVAEATDWIRAFAYWLRESHHYREAAGMHRLLADLGDGRVATLASMVKLAVHRFQSAVLRREPLTPVFVRRPREPLNV
jgi:hypothetical protein